MVLPDDWSSSYAVELGSETIHRAELNFPVPNAPMRANQQPTEDSEHIDPIGASSEFLGLRLLDSCLNLRRCALLAKILLRSLLFPWLVNSGVRAAVQVQGRHQPLGLLVRDITAS